MRSTVQVSFSLYAEEAKLRQEGEGEALLCVAVFLSREGREGGEEGRERERERGERERRERRERTMPEAREKENREFFSFT